MHPNMVQTRAASASMVRIYGVKGVILALRSYENLSLSLVEIVDRHYVVIFEFDTFRAF